MHDLVEPVLDSTIFGYKIFFRVAVQMVLTRFHCNEIGNLDRKVLLCCIDSDKGVDLVT